MRLATLFNNPALIRALVSRQVESEYKQNKFVPCYFPPHVRILDNKQTSKLARRETSTQLLELEPFCEMEARCLERYDQRISRLREAKSHLRPNGLTGIKL